MSASYKTIKKRLAKPDGKERIIAESLHYGVDETAYTYVDDANVAGLIEGIHFTKSPNSLFVDLTDKGLKEFCHALNTLAYFTRYN